MPIRQKIHTTSPDFDLQDEYHPLIATWMLRMLLGSSSAFCGFFDVKRGFRDSDVSDFLQMQDLDDDTIKVAELKALMRTRLAHHEKTSSGSPTLFRNIAMMAKRVAITPLQQQVLAFAVLCERYEAMGTCLGNITMATEPQLYSVLGHALEVSAGEVKGALARSSPLRASGLISVTSGHCGNMEITPMDGLCEALLADNENEKDLLRHFLVPARPTTLRAADYPHAQKDMDILSRLLKVAVGQGERGVNILLYGPPGTGKTELARLLARQIKSPLFEVKTEDADGDPIKSNCRLEGYRFCQQMLARDRRSILLFDEVEDVFPARSFSFFGMEVKSGENKGWLNRMLEENPTPAIWICNQISQIDPAFLRRFDYVMELNTPPRSVRLNIVRARLANTPVSESFMQRLAEHEELSPAQIAKASQALKRLACKDQSTAEATLERVLGNGARAMGQKPLIRQGRHATHYSLDYLNADEDIASLIPGLQRSGCGNICFYGPPGTGKTALAGYIAEQLDKPLLARRASDILSKWLGEAEQNIARMFEQARSEGAVLILDEADSLLRDRRGADHSWEVTQVNELLVQMENFDGLFICSTNLMDDLDQASLRRFDIKVKLDYLKPDQAWQMLQKECTGTPGPKDRQALAATRNLAPGDFAAVKKRLAILGRQATPDALIAGLMQECALKGAQSGGGIGFIC